MHIIQAKIDARWQYIGIYFMHHRLKKVEVISLWARKEMKKKYVFKITIPCFNKMSLNFNLQILRFIHRIWIYPLLRLPYFFIYFSFLSHVHFWREKKDQFLHDKLEISLMKYNFILIHSHEAYKFSFQNLV